MIIYVFNQFFPEDSGFGRRCKREIEALSKKEEVTVVCRHDEGQRTEEYYLAGGMPIRIIRYKAKSEIVHRPEGYKSNGLYELKRNADIMIALLFTLVKLFSDRKKKPVHLFAVTSPLTIPFLGMILAKVFGAEARVVSFHDLEPELAMHLKNLKPDNWLVKVELILEKIVCRSYKKILVTTEGQAQRISDRTGVPLSKICSIENSTDMSANKSGDKSLLDGIRDRNSFVLFYLSTISFDYTIEGLQDFLKHLAKVKDQVPSLKLVIVGAGEGLNLLKSTITDLGLAENVITLGQVNNPAALLSQGDAAIIPWHQDIMTETMLPTKLFEYLSLGLPVIAPKFGEFKRVLIDQKNALLFETEQDIVEDIKVLSDDKKLARQIGEAGHELYLKSYQPRTLNEKLLAFYSQP